MNFKPLKALIPHWSVGVVITLIVAMGLAYYASVKQSTTHLISRNFVHLNEVSDVLEETFEVLEQLARFTGTFCTGNDTACLNGRLVANSPYVTEISQVRTGVKRSVSEESSLACDQDIAESATQQRSAIETEISMDRKGITTSWWPQLACSMNMLVVPFQNVSGLTDAVPYFDSLLIASDDEGSVLFDSANLGLQAQPGKPETYFSDNGSYERYSTINELIRQKRILDTTDAAAKQANDSAVAFPQSTIVPLLVGGIRYLAFIQPLVSKTVGNQKLYIIGMVREGAFDSDRYSIPLSTSAFCLLLLVLTLLSLSLIRIVLIEENGIVGRWDLYILVGSMLGLVSLLTLIIYAGATASNISRWQDDDLSLIARNMAIRFQQEVYSKVSLMQSAEQEFNRSVYHGSNRSRASNKSLYGANKTRSQNVCKIYELDNQTKDPALSCETDRIPEFTTVYTLDKNGQQAGMLASFRSFEHRIVKPFNVASREYFKRVNSGNLWPIPGLELTKSKPGRQCPGSIERCLPAYPTGSTKNVFIDRIKSRGTGRLETVLATQANQALCWGNRNAPYSTTCPSENANQPVALVGLTTMRSLEEAVLPPGFGYVLFNSDSGQVLFHSEKGRGLLENFYDSAAHDLKFKTRIALGLSGTMDLTYKGDNIRANVIPLGSAPLSVAVYFKHELLRTLIFQFCITAFLLVLVFLIYQFSVLVCCEWVRNKLFKADAGGSRSPIRPMWVLNISLGALACLYGLLIFYLDGLLLIAMSLLVPLVIYVLGRTIGAPFFSWVVTGPSQDIRDWRRDPVRASRWTAFLMAILLAVLPTSAIFNESMDLHERSWRQLDNWWTTNAISRRADFFMASLSGMNLDTGTSHWDILVDSISEKSGLYLPNTSVGFGRDNGDGKSCETQPAGFDLAGFAGSPEPSRIRSSRMSICQVTGRPETFSVAPPTPGVMAILALLPEMTLMSSILNRFAEASEGWLHQFGQCKNHALASAYCSVLINTRAGLMFLLEETYPLTRSAESGFFLGLGLLYLALLLVLLLGAWQFLNMIAPVRLIREIRRQARNDFEREAASFYAVVPATVGDAEKESLIEHIRGQLDLSVPEDPELAQYLLVNMGDDFTTVLLRDIEKLLEQPATEKVVRQWLISQESTGRLCLLFVSRLDLKYLRIRQRRGDGLISEGVKDWDHLLTGLVCVPFYKLIRYSGNPDNRSEHPESDSKIDTLYISRVGRGVSERDYFKLWEKSSFDEKMALASLTYNGVTNVSNVASLFSLYNRGLISVAPVGINIRNQSFLNYVRQRFPRATFLQEAAGYHDDRWRIFRAPIYIGLGALLLFVAYAAQDDITYAFRIFGGIGTALAAVSAINEKYRSLALKE